MEQFKTLCYCHLNGNITNSATTLSATTFGEPWRFPTRGNFRVVIDGEIILVTAVTGSSTPYTFTLVRGQEGTTAISHSAGAPIALIGTYGAMQQFRKDNTEYDTVANLKTNQAADPKAGRLSFSSDGFQTFLDKGSAPHTVNGCLWELTPPLVSAFTWRNQNSAIADNNNGYLYMAAPSNGTGTEFNILERTCPATPWTLTTYLMANRHPKDFMMAGLILYETSSGKAISLHTDSSSGEKIEVVWWNSLTSFNSTKYQQIVRAMGDQLNWYRIINNGTNLDLSISHEGYIYRNVYLASKSAWFTSGPDRFGLFVQLGQPGTGFIQDLSCLHWKVT